MISQQLFYTHSVQQSSIILSNCVSGYIYVIVSASVPKLTSSICKMLLCTHFCNIPLVAPVLGRSDLVTSNLNPCQVGAWRRPEISGENYRDYQTFFRAVTFSWSGLHPGPGYCSSKYWYWLTLILDLLQATLIYLMIVTGEEKIIIKLFQVWNKNKVIIHTTARRQKVLHRELLLKLL